MPRRARDCPQPQDKKRGAVRIPSRLLPHLKRARKRGSDLGYVLHDHGARIGDIKKGFAAACKRAGLEGVMPHTLRHTCATWLMQRGADLWQASGFLSMSVETLLRVYGHHHPDWMKDAAEMIGERPANRLRAHSAPTRISGSGISAAKLLK